ncbi:hypothetical protein [Magnetospirillum sulfuroxidans]|uniref:ApeI dehydratase-like domain-containing protein n=1 Tax=Magnetospirillum sulfuroxidans TaxID=611300 RepID=A0ABS5I6X9_9PROT|nr:hypothetical protein [Magnetospirillum sulfuroxidans]MBR9970180.1 hypothetical protein [Magnetospirillum sulfuroxidans]
MTQSPRLPLILTHRPIATGAELDLFIDPALLWFRGHFPDFLLLPGVVQLDWALTLAEQYLGLAAEPASQFQVKYKGAIFPGDSVTLALRHDPAKARLTFDYRRDGAVCSSGSVAVAP